MMQVQQHSTTQYSIPYTQSKDGFQKEEGSENENAPSRNDNNQIPYVIGKFHKKFKHNINRSMKEIQKKTCIR